MNSRPIANLNFDILIFTGIDDEVIQAAGKNVEDDGDIKEDDEVQEDTAFT